MRESPDSGFIEFFRKNPEVDSLLGKIDSKKMDGEYLARRVIKGGIPGYLLKIRLFVPSVSAIRRGNKREAPMLKEIWVERSKLRLIMFAPPGGLDVGDLSYDGLRLNVKRSDRGNMTFFVGLPLKWANKKISYSNGILEIDVPLKKWRRAHSRMNLSSSSTRVSKP